MSSKNANHLSRSNSRSVSGVASGERRSPYNPESDFKRTGKRAAQSSMTSIVPNVPASTSKFNFQEAVPLYQEDYIKVSMDHLPIGVDIVVKEEKDLVIKSGKNAGQLAYFIIAYPSYEPNIVYGFWLPKSLVAQYLDNRRRGRRLLALKRSSIADVVAAYGIDEVSGAILNQELDGYDPETNDDAHTDPECSSGDEVDMNDV